MIPESDYMKTSEITKKYGFTSQTITRLARIGKIPGAHQPFGEYGGWRFNREKFENWWKSKEIEKIECHPSINAEKTRSGGAKPTLRVKRTAKALKQQIKELHEKNLKSGLKN